LRSAQWELLRGFGLQLRDTYGAALCVSLHQPNAKGDNRNVHGHIFMTGRVVDEEGNLSKTKIRSLRDKCCDEFGRAVCRLPILPCNPGD
jgi:hypothetical protein